MSNNPVIGFNYFTSGFSLIFQPGIKRYVIIPTLINIVVFIGLFFLLRHYFIEFMHWVMHFLPLWLQWLSVILWLFFIATFFIFFVYTFVMIGNIISAPFNSFLAEKIEFYLTGKQLEQRSLGDNLKDIPRILGRQFGILAYYLPRALLLLILFLIPVIQPIIAVLWFLFHAWYLSFTYIDYPTDNHRIALTDVRVWLKSRTWTTYGFGMGVLVFSMIPIVNFLVIPAAVAGATKFWVSEN